MGIIDSVVETLEGIFASDNNDKQDNPRDISDTISERVKMCGIFRSRDFDGEVGSKKIYPWFCGDWNACLGCLGRRARHFQLIIENALYFFKEQNVQIRFVEMAHDEAIALIRVLKKDRYLRFPLDNGNQFIFFAPMNEDQEQIGEPVTFDANNNLDWMRIAKTPHGSKTAGRLFKEEKSKDGEAFFVLTTLSNAPIKVQDAFQDQAIAATPDLDPQTPSAAFEAREQRRKLYDSYLEKAGYDVIHAPRTIRIRAEKINWQKGKERIMLDDFEGMARLEARLAMA